MTHNEKVLQLLSDGQPHSHLEGYRLGVMLHSRVADLRKKGYRIECWRQDDLYLYWLDMESGPLDEPAAGHRAAGSSSGAGTAGGSPPPWEQPAVFADASTGDTDAAPLEPIPGQMSLEAA